MISDSPYKFRDAILSPGQGILGGCVGSLLMLVLLAILEPVSGVSLRGAPEQVGQVCPWGCGGTSPVAAGLGVHL